MYPNELILVVKRSLLFKKIEPWDGIKEIKKDFLNTINTEHEFHQRSLMENDPTFKQIIPYLVFMYRNSIFLMKRKTELGESRLAGKYTIGIGGHIRKEDLENASNISDWALREFSEEVDYKGNYVLEELGLINDESNEVGRVHMGVLYLLKGDLELISIKEELESGELIDINDCIKYYDLMESWSRIAINFILKNKQK